MKQARELVSNQGLLDSLTSSFSVYGILWAVFFSLIGFGFFVYGKKSVNYVFLFCGIILMVYPYFITGTLYIVLAGAVLSAVPFILRA